MATEAQEEADFVLTTMERSALNGITSPLLFQDMREARELSFALSTELGAYRSGLDRYATLAADPHWSFARASIAYETTPAGALVQVAANTPRVNSRGLLIEPTRTNLLLQSQQFENASWLKANATITADATTAPDATTTADKYAASSTANPVLVQVPTLAAGSYAVSVYAKMVDRRYLVVNFQSKGADNFTYFDLQNGVVTFQSGDSVARIQPLSNSWFRCTVIRPATAGARQIVFQHSSSPNSITAPVAGQSIYLWGAQVEAGAGATSYIPTTTTSATRNADQAAVSFAAPAGFVFIEFVAPAPGSNVLALAANVGVPVAIDNGAVFTTNSVTNLYSGVTVAEGQVVRALLTWAPGRRSISVNGTTASDTAAAGAFTSLQIGGSDGRLNSFVRQLRWGDWELTLDQINAITAPPTAGNSPITAQLPTAGATTAWAVTAEFGGDDRVRLGQQGVNDYSPGAGVVQVTAETGGAVELTRYQYGSTLRTSGPNSGIFEFFIGDNPTDGADLSVRGNGSLGGAKIYARDAADTYGVMLAATGTARTRVGPDSLAPNEFMLQHGSDNGFFTFATGVDQQGENGDEWARLDHGALRLRETVAEPANPPEGHFVQWMSNGTGAGDDGDIMMKITAGGVTKTTTLVDFSAI